MISIPFLPKPRLLDYLQTQCHEEADFGRGVFSDALDLDVSQVNSQATVESVVIADVMIESNGILVSYDVHYRVLNAGTGADIRNYLDRQVFGSKGANGWEFQSFLMPVMSSMPDVP